MKTPRAGSMNRALWRMGHRYIRHRASRRPRGHTSRTSPRLLLHARPPVQRVPFARAPDFLVEAHSIEETETRAAP